MSNYRLARIVFSCVLAILIVPTVLLGQEYRATITGIVTDSSKAVVPDATVTVRNLDTGEVITAKTNSAGVYTVPFLRRPTSNCSASLARRIFTISSRTWKV